jgi:hypothetical protein
VNTILCAAYYIKNDYQNALNYCDMNIDKAIKRGDVPKEQEMQIAVSACEKLEDQKCAMRELERMVMYQPKPEYWVQFVYMVRQKPCEAERILKEALASTSFTDPSQRGTTQRILERRDIQKLLDDATRRCAGDRPAIPGGELQRPPMPSPSSESPLRGESSVLTNYSGP